MKYAEDSMMIIAYHELDALRQWSRDKIEVSFQHKTQGCGGLISEAVFKVHNPFSKTDVLYRHKYFFVSLKHDTGVHNAAGLRADGIHLVDGVINTFQHNYLESRMFRKCLTCS